jgi:hypothetical protein
VNLIHSIKMTLLLVPLMIILMVAPSLADLHIYTDVDTGTVLFSGISEGSTTDAGPLYGQPMYFSGNQLFFPTSFVSTATDGSNDSTIGELNMTISAAGGYAIQSIAITEYGNYTLTGTGTSDTSASIFSTYNVGGQSGTISMSPKDAYNLDTDGAGTGFFSGSVSLDFSGSGINELSFFLSNDLETTSESGTTASIEKSLESNQVVVEIITSPIPIPGALWLFGSAIGAIGVFRRRKS